MFVHSPRACLTPIEIGSNAAPRGVLTIKRIVSCPCVGFDWPDDVSIAAAIEANDAFIARLEAIRDSAQRRTIHLNRQK
jgi:hypothetical protein